MSAPLIDHLPPLPPRPWQKRPLDFARERYPASRPTPVLHAQATSGQFTHSLLMKLEVYNLTGSIKDRTARGLMNDLRLRGLIREDSIVIESSSGNLAVALAYLAHSIGVGFTAVVDPLITEQNRARLDVLGATVVTVDRADKNGSYLHARLDAVAQLCASDPRYVWPNQYANPANPAIHYYETGPELLAQTPDDLGAVFIATSTCGTLAGIASAFRDHRPKTRVIAVDAAGSTIFRQSSHRRRLVGIGSSRQPEFALERLIDDVSIVTDREAFETCHALARSGVRLGGSSGAAVHAAARFLAAGDRPLTVACVCPDGGENYESSIYAPEWLDNVIGDSARVLDVHAVCTSAGDVTITPTLLATRKDASS